MSTLTTSQLINGMFSLRLARSPIAVQHGPTLMNMLNKLRPSRIVQRHVIKRTLFAHFCVGETLGTAAKKISEMEKSRVYSILDYAAEAPLHDESLIDFEGSVGRTKETLRVVADTSEVPMMATKITGFGPMDCLQSTSDIIQICTELFRAIIFREEFGANLFDSQPFDQLFHHQIDFEMFNDFANQTGFVHISEEDFEYLTHVFNNCNAKYREGNVLFPDKKLTLFALHEGTLSFLKGELPTRAVKIMHSILSYCSTKVPRPVQLVYEPENDFAKTVNRFMEALSELPVLTTNEKKMPLVLVDAEYYNTQPVIDVLCRHVCLSLNGESSAFIGNTYQCYLKEAKAKLMFDIKVHQALNIEFACKLVRGAYLSNERTLAASEGRPDPLHVDKKATDNMFDENAEVLVELIMKSQARTVFGTHNKISTELIIEHSSRLQKLGHSLRKGNLMVAQLMGMRDELTQKIAKSNVVACKYVPFGPIDLVIPYLIRRMQENNVMLSSAIEDSKYLGGLLRLKVVKNVFGALLNAISIA